MSKNPTTHNTVYVPCNYEMTNKEFKDSLDKLLKPHGFTKKGNEWRTETTELYKVVELQKSNFSNLYYLNYGYSFKDLDYDGVKLHIDNRFASADPNINKIIQDTFDLDKQMDSSTRLNHLNDLINNILLTEINSTTNKADILESLKTRPTLNDIPLRVKEYLSIKIE